MENLVFENSLGKVEITVPIIRPDELDFLLLNLRQAQNNLSSIDANELKELFSENLSMWLNPNYELRQHLEEVLPVTLGYSPQMVQVMLDQMFKKLAYDFEHLNVPIKREGIVVNVVPDVPGAQIVTILQSLLAGMPVFLKSPSNEPIFSATYVNSLANLDEKIANSLAVVHWKGGAKETVLLEEFLYNNLTSSDWIVAFGSPKLEKNIDEKRNPETQLIAHTKGLGVAILGKEQLSSKYINLISDTCAFNIAMYNRTACASLQPILVEKGGENSPEEFAQMLAQSMHNIAQDSLPIGHFSGDLYGEFIKKHRSYILKHHADLLQYTPISAPLEGKTKPIGGVIYLNNGDFELPASPGRFVTVIPVPDISKTEEILISYIDNIHTIGLSVEQERYGLLKKVYETKGIRVTPLVDMLDLSFPDYPLF